MREDWLIKELGNVCFTTSGGTPNRNNKAYYSGTIPWVKSGELKYSTITKTEENISYEALANSSAKLVPKGSLLIALYGATVGRLGFLGVEAATNQAVASIMCFAGMPNKYLYYYLLNRKEELLNKRIGGAQPNISQTILNELEIPLPPLNEQHRIVSKIEELFSELDNGVANLKRAQKQLKVYRQALLKYAFEGKLTEQWRKENNPEPAEKLLERIKAERLNRYEQEVKDWKAAVKAWEKDGKIGRKPGKPKAPKSVSQIPKEKIDLLSIIPNGWNWTQSGNLFLYITSGSRGWAEFYSESGAIFIRITNLNFDTLELDLSPNKIQFVKTPENSEGIRTKVKEGDFLFSITGYLGMFAIAPKLVDAYVNQHVALVRPSKLNNLRFLGYWIIAKNGGFHFLNEKNKGAVKAGLNLNDILEFPIPICSVEEQNMIANRLESQFSIIENLEKTIESSLQKSEALRQSILKKAFEGKLVPQDPNDEPASELLKRIQAEKKKYLEEQKQQKKKKSAKTLNHA